MTNYKREIIVEDRDESYKLVSDCSRCSGLCCIALYCFQSDGFPQDKPIGKPCINLMDNFKCRIHEDLESMGMRGCIGYDCFGAGQYLTEEIYGGVTWKTQPGKTKEICDMYMLIYRLFQLRFFLYESRKLVSSEVLLPEISRLLQENDSICKLPMQEMLKYPIDAYQDKVNGVLKKSCAALKNYLKVKNNIGKDYLNRNFEGENLDGADLKEAVFLSQGQINAAKGSRRTKLPKHLKYPDTWR